jgi:thioredoxin reductase (NADPH)
MQLSAILEAITAASTGLAGSGAAALDLLNRLKERGDLIALFPVDQRMPGMTGTELLGEARKIYPEAKKVLLTAYADT